MLQEHHLTFAPHSTNVSIRTADCTEQRGRSKILGVNSVKKVIFCMGHSIHYQIMKKKENTKMP